MNTTPPTPTNDGGPAFPTHVPEGPIMPDGYPSEPAYTKQGMALQGKATRLNNPHEHRDILSSDCYDIADAMLKAREVKP